MLLIKARENAFLSGRVASQFSALVFFLSILVQVILIALASSADSLVTSFLRAMCKSAILFLGVVARELVAAVQVFSPVGFSGSLQSGCVVLGGALSCVLNVASLKENTLSNKQGKAH